MDADYNPRSTPWSIDGSEYQGLATLKAKARFLLGYAILAPSSHNTQPWKFGVVDDGVLVYADYSRRLPVANPEDRELVMSVAAAITNYRVAAAHYGLACEVKHVPEPHNYELLAYIRISEGRADPRMAGLFEGILKRRTNRSAYQPGDLSDDDLVALRSFAPFGGADALIVTEQGRKARLAEIVSDGDLRRMADKAFTRELSEWIRPARSDDADGIPAVSLGIPPLVSPLAPWIVRTFNMSKSQADKDSAAVRDSAALLVVHSTDDKVSVLEAGELLEMVLLKCALSGIQLSFFSLPVELDDLRAKIKAVVGISDEPQLLLRMGYGRRTEILSPRRSVDQVLAEG